MKLPTGMIMKTKRNQFTKHSVLATGMAALILCGCAQFRAIDQPKPFKPTVTAVGAKRVNITGELGAPINSEENNGKLVDTYKYVDGGGKNSGGAKVGRIILYTAGDLFTLFLDQLITWPAEIYGFAGTPHIVTVEYQKGTDGFWHAVSVDDLEQVGKKEATEKLESPKAKSDSSADKQMTVEPKSEAPSTNVPVEAPKA